MLWHFGKGGAPTLKQARTPNCLPFSATRPEEKDLIMRLSQQLSRWAWGIGVVLVAGSLQAERAKTSPPLRYTARTPDEMLDFALRRATAGGDGALPGLALAYALADRAAAGHARRGLETLGRSDGEVPTQARWIAAELDPLRQRCPRASFADGRILGPFQDSGGGLTRHEGPEEAGKKWGDPKSSFAWGAYEVRWREVPSEVISARGVPLDLIDPASQRELLVPRDQGRRERTIALRSARRLEWIGAPASGTASTPRAAKKTIKGWCSIAWPPKIDPALGDHVLGVKVCTGALSDDGRVRVRASDPEGKPLDLETSADPRDRDPDGQTARSFRSSPRLPRRSRPGRIRRRSARSRGGDHANVGQRRRSRVHRVHRGSWTRSPTARRSPPTSWRSPVGSRLLARLVAGG